ncbi:MAG: hypothetical protein LBS48_05085 [Treponema sp.]|jgi:predicted dehydrogenase|nr:hypothetical protein [Treponema sp.]
MNAKFKIAFIGCGRIAGHHAKAWREAGNGKGEITACADISQETLEW